MKKITCFLVFLFFLVGKKSFCQTIVFHEDFEVADSVTSSGTPTWFQDANYSTNGIHSYRDTISQNGTAYLTSNTFSTNGNFFVVLSFDQVCKISFADRAYIEVSNDNGNTWNILNATNYLGASSYFPIYNYFASFSYGASGWDAAHDAALPTNSWWRTEVFDISSVAANSSQVKIRFRITDGNGNGNSGNYGWLIDRVEVQAAPHELVPPSIRWSPPVLQGTIYSLGPFVVSDTITDGSAINSATLHYTINGGTPVSVVMNNSGNIYHGIIPAVSAGDTVCYYVQAADVWGNTSALPANGCLSFVASIGISFPYFDSFDVNTIWEDSTVNGSSWQLGMPAFELTTGTHSGLNAWDVSLTTAYVNNTRTILTSPIFNFLGTYNAELSFWRNHNSENNFDGVRVECTTNGTNWWLLGRLGDVRGTNWYTHANISSNPGPAFSGSSGGWIQSKYRLDTLNNSAGPVQFRFVFTSDPSVVRDGFSIDDFSILLPPPHDVGVTSIILPGTNSPSNIVDSVRIAFHNFGSDTTSNFQVAYKVNSGSPVTQIYPGVLQPGANDTVTFAIPYVVPEGLFNICAWTGATNDGNPLNDSICKSSYGLTRLNIPYTDNLDTGVVLWLNTSLVGTNWQLGTPAFGQTNSAHSNPNAWDINLYSTYGSNARSVLTSPLFDFTNHYNTRLSFWMNRNIATGDGAFLEFSLNGGTTWQRLGVVNDPNALNNSWYTNANINLTNLPGWDGSSGGWVKYTYILGSPFNNAGQNVQFRFVFTSNATFTTDGISIDDISLMDPSPIDLGITSLIQPGLSIEAGSNGVVQFMFRNFGTNNVTSADFSYSINDTLVSTESWIGNLTPGSSMARTFATPFVVPQGQYEVCVYLTNSSDGDHSNDTLCQTKYGIPLFTLPFTDSFDTGANYWADSSAGTGTKWERGTPAYGQTTGAHSPPMCWDINLTTVYQNNARSYLVSPLFDLTGITNARLAFWQNRNAEAAWDGTRLQYSINGGATWTILGSYNDPGAINWYTDPSINTDQLPAWEGTSLSAAGSPGWQQSTYLNLPLAVYGHVVQFRFVFVSDASVTRDGFSMDDFQLWVPPPVGIISSEDQTRLISIYPNPSDGIFYVSIGRVKQKVIDILITDILGNEIWKNSFNQSGILPIDLSQQPKGIYFLKMNSDSGTISQRMVLCN